MKPPLLASQSSAGVGRPSEHRNASPSDDSLVRSEKSQTVAKSCRRYQAVRGIRGEPQEADARRGYPRSDRNTVKKGSSAISCIQASSGCLTRRRPVPPIIASCQRLIALTPTDSFLRVARSKARSGRGRAFLDLSASETRCGCLPKASAQRLPEFACIKMHDISDFLGCSRHAALRRSASLSSSSQARHRLASLRDDKRGSCCHLVQKA